MLYNTFVIPGLIRYLNCIRIVTPNDAHSSAHQPTLSGTCQVRSNVLLTWFEVTQDPLVGFLIWRAHKLPAFSVQFCFLDQFLRLYDTSRGRFTETKKIRARNIGWSILDTVLSPDKRHLVYSSWSDSSQFHIETLFVTASFHTASETSGTARSFSTTLCRGVSVFWTRQ